jgi:class 3 adenylate cyclase/predicted ATPase
VTILFSDIKGSTSFAENLDPEDVLEIMNKAFRVLIDPVVKYEGKVARLMGDAILAFFGAPVSHEDDADRACRAALDIISESTKFAEELSAEKGIEEFSVRVGINTGLVVVGEVGSDINVEYTAMGDAVNVAARMESLAEPGTILITEETKKHLKTAFSLESLGKIKVKGKREPINTFRLTGIPRDRIAEKQSGDFKTILIGRESELGLITSAFQDLNSNSGGIISIYGDKGVGKSRLAQESRKYLKRDIRWIEEKAEAFANKNPYWLMKNCLRNCMQLVTEETEEDAVKRVRTYSKSFCDKDESRLSFLLHFLNFRKYDGTTSNEFKVSREVLKNQMHHTIKEFIRFDIKKNPSVFVFDNLQWSDSPSREILSELITIAHEIPLLIILIYRLDETHKEIWEFHNKYIDIPGGRNIMIRVRAFELNDTYTLIKELLEVKTVPQNLINRIYDKTRGNPLYIEDVINSFLEKGILEKDEDKLIVGNYDKEFMVSNLLHSALLSRIDSLNKAEKLTLQTAALIGRVFQEKLLYSILKTKISREELNNILIILQQKELILRHLSSRTGKKVLFEREYVFKNPLIHEVVYSTILLSQRQELHKQIGEAIEFIYRENIGELTISLASHFEKGREFRKAFNYYLKAGDKATDLFDNEDAFYFYLKALDQSKNVTVDKKLRCKLHDSLAKLYSISAKYQLALDHYSLVLKYNMNDNYETSKTYRKIGLIYVDLGEYEKAHEYLNLSLNKINYKSDETEAAHIFSLLGIVFFREGKLSEAEKYSSRALNILREKKVNQYLCEVYNNLGNIYAQLNKYDISLKYHKKCLSLREKFNDIQGLAASHNNIGHLYELQGIFDKAAEYYHVGLELCEKVGNLHGLARIYDNLSNLYNNKGEDELASSYNLKALGLIGKISGNDTLNKSSIWMQSGVW